MPSRVKSRTDGPANRFLHAAKISEYQFKRVLWHYALDHSAAEASRDIRLSVNSIAALFDKLRRFFTDLGVFDDVYNGNDPREGIDGNDELMEYERGLIAFHLRRLKDKRRMKPTDIEEVDPHWGESAWRYDYAVMTEGRASDAIHRMMYAHLLAYIRLSGPVGRPPRNCKASMQLKLEQFDQRVRWLERNSFSLQSADDRLKLKEILEI